MRTKSAALEVGLYHLLLTALVLKGLCPVCAERKRVRKGWGERKGTPPGRVLEAFDREVLAFRI